MEYIKPILAGKLRHIATFAGGYLVAHGLASKSQGAEVSGVIMAAGGLAWSIASNYLKAQAAKNSSAVPPISVLSKQ
jgi:hypothetical protein